MQRQIANELIDLIAMAQTQFSTIADREWNLKPSPAKWSKKEILGHLIDSAQNNLRRFVVSQYQENDKIYYHQDEWVEYQNYQEADTKDIIALWALLNKQLARTLMNIPADRLKNTCDTGKTKQEFYSLEFLAEDYVVHLKHHLSQILQR